jgi:EmrB/QacA subfamily drug resistance transporter
VLALMLAAQFMVVLDVSVVYVALPSLGSTLHCSSADVQWAVSAYVLLSGGLLLLGGRLADLFDRKRVFLIGLAVFTLGSLASGLAASPLGLILARAAQGSGAALLTPAAMAVVMTTYSGRQRATALGIWGTVASMGIAAGVLFGGVLTSLLDWRAVFFVNVPIGLLTWWGAARSVQPLRAVAQGRSMARLDVPGALTAVIGLVSLVYAVESLRSNGWTAPATLVAAVAAAALLGAFVAIERRAPEPLVPPAIWRVRSLVSASAVMAGVTGAVVGGIFLTSLYLQQVLGASPIVAGLEFLPLAAVITVSAAVASRLLSTVGARTLTVAGLVVAAAGAALLATVDAGSSYAGGVLPGLLVFGLGVGPMFVALSVAAMAGIPAEHSGLASGVMMTGHEVGAALGVASMTAIAGDLTTRAGLMDGFPTVFTVVAIAMVALAGFVVLAVPRQHAHDVQHAGMH